MSPCAKMVQKGPDPNGTIFAKKYRICLGIKNYT